jgi:ATP diphosphatase
LQKRAARVNFDWPDRTSVLDKLEEEISELKHALQSGETDCVEDEMGDVLFTCVNLSRHLGLDAEASLRRASGKFEQRFSHMEALATAQGSHLGELRPDELDRLWERAKSEEAGPG